MYGSSKMNNLFQKGCESKVGLGLARKYGTYGCKYGTCPIFMTSTLFIICCLSPQIVKTMSAYQEKLRQTSTWFWITDI